MTWVTVSETSDLVMDILKLAEKGGKVVMDRLTGRRTKTGKYKDPEKESEKNKCLVIRAEGKCGSPVLHPCRLNKHNKPNLLF